MAKSTTSTISKNKDAIEGADKARGIMVLAKQRTPVLGKVETFLSAWLKGKLQAGDSVTIATICEKAWELHHDFLQEDPSPSAASDEFKAHRDWLDEFQKSSGVHRVIRHGEASSFAQAAAEAWREEFLGLLKAERCATQ